MNELQQWLDKDPESRRCSVVFEGLLGWSVHVWHVGHLASKGQGEGNGWSVTFAAVLAIVDWERLER